MNSSDMDFFYPEKFELHRKEGEVFNLRGCIDKNQRFFLLTSEDVTPSDIVHRLLSTGRREKYAILDAHFFEESEISPAMQKLRVKRDFD